MNFFGHATVACWFGREAAFVLGAMLPDFASMAGARLREVRGTRLQDGVDLHHRTDALFHRHPSFVSLCERAGAALRAGGVSRGGAAGAAHVGVELLIDGQLLEQKEVGQAYLAALAHARDGAVDQILWRAPEGQARFHAVIERLHSVGLPRAYTDPEEVASILVRILSRRPALALSEEETTTLRRVLPELAPHVTDAVPILLETLQSELTRGDDAA